MPDRAARKPPKRKSGTAPKPKRRTPWQNSGHSQDEVFIQRRAALLRKAMMAFRGWNYHQITMDEIAADLGVAKPTLYNYVKSKQEILYEGHKLSLDYADQAFAEAQAAGGSVSDRLRILCRTYSALLADGRGGAAISLFVEALPETQRKEIEARRRMFRHLLEELISEGIKDGSIRPLEPTVASYFFLGAVNWLMKWYEPGKTVTGDDLGEQFAGFFLDGIATR